MTEKRLEYAIVFTFDNESEARSMYKLPKGSYYSDFILHKDVDIDNKCRMVVRKAHMKPSVVAKIGKKKRESIIKPTLGFK